MVARRVRSFVIFTASTLLLFACAASPEEPSASQSSSELTSSGPAVQASCRDECAAAGSTCPTTCGATPQECAAATAICFKSCDRGVGPWLPC